MSTDGVVIIYTDGACEPNPGSGGYGAILYYKKGDKEGKKEITGGEHNTTNNRMEMMAAIAALEALTKPSKVRLYSDSQYVIKGISEWIIGWRKNNWKNGTVKNIDLWHRLDAVSSIHDIEWKWVKGHNGDPMNELADALAVASIKKHSNK